MQERLNGNIQQLTEAAYFRHQQTVNRAFELLERYRSKNPSVACVKQECHSAISEHILRQPSRIKEGIWLPENPKDRTVLSIRPSRIQLVRGNSSHNVSLIETSFYQGRKKVESYGILKPFDNPNGGIIELINTSYVRELGYDTVDPLIAIVDHQKSYIISKFRPDVVFTLDLHNWPEYLITNEKSQIDAKNKLTKISKLLASYHTHGIAHRDAQVKNFALTPVGDIIGIDFESAKIFNNLSGNNLKNFAAGMIHDLYLLFSSITRPTEEAGVGYFTRLNKQSRWYEFAKLVLEPYRSTFLETDSPLITLESKYDILEVVENTLEKKILQYMPVMH